MQSRAIDALPPWLLDATIAPNRVKSLQHFTVVAKNLLHSEATLGILRSTPGLEEGFFGDASAIRIGEP